SWKSGRNVKLVSRLVCAARAYSCGRASVLRLSCLGLTSARCSTSFQVVLAASSWSWSWSWSWPC
ncbi:hypothetical protein J6590_032646, partial [Homalodisca vitripennis]